MARKYFDKDFKLEAENMVTSQQRPVAAVARELGIYENTLYKWINQTSENKEGTFAGNGNLSPKEAELRKLKSKICRYRIGERHLEKGHSILRQASEIVYRFLCNRTNS